ncbi:MAG: phosphotransferase [Rhodobacteraceae bacterium]|nr:phosphotransferase [Paracoccaceae bacterium]
MPKKFLTGFSRLRFHKFLNAISCLICDQWRIYSCNACSPEHEAQHTARLCIRADGEPATTDVQRNLGRAINCMDVGKQIRVSASAANPGAANALLSVLSAHVSAGVDVRILSQEPATTILTPHCQELGIELSTCSIPRHGIEETAQDTALQLSDFVKSWLHKAQTNAVLCGLSGPDMGVDEWLIHHARQAGIATYSLQDYPGWVVNGVSGPADTYFVESGAAGETTRNIGGASRTVETGRLALVKLEKAVRKFTDLPVFEANEAVFLGQPLWGYKGYRRTLQHVRLCAEQIGIDRLWYQPHPLERDEFEMFVQRESTMTGFRKSEKSYTEVIARTPTLFSAYSTGLEDAAFVHRYLQRSPPKLIYCLFEPDLKQQFIAASQPLEDTIQQRPHAAFALDRTGPLSINQLTAHPASAVFDFPAPHPETVARTIMEDLKAARAPEAQFLPTHQAANESLTGHPEFLDRGISDRLRLSLTGIFATVGLQISQITQILPPRDGLSYYRAELSGIGAVFIKSIPSGKAGRDQRSFEIERRVSETCNCLAMPIKPAPLTFYDPEDGLQKQLFAWKFLEGRGIDAANQTQISALASELAHLHGALLEFQNETRFKPDLDRAEKHRAWLCDSYRQIQTESLKGQYVPQLDGFPLLQSFVSNDHTGFLERFFSADCQLVHGDLNPGNLLWVPGEHRGSVAFLDFEEATQSLFPACFDIAVLIERLFLVSEGPGTEWMPQAELLLKGYSRARGGTCLHTENDLNDALVFATIRSLVILIELEKAGRPASQKEWEKFENLCVLHQRFKGEMKTLARWAIST